MTSIQTEECPVARESWDELFDSRREWMGKAERARVAPKMTAKPAVEKCPGCWNCDEYIGKAAFYPKLGYRYKVPARQHLFGPYLEKMVIEVPCDGSGWLLVSQDVDAKPESKRIATTVTRIDGVLKIDGRAA